MKIKTDFVTNSSSTSFVVFWPNKIKTIEDVSKIINNESNKTIIKIYEDSIQDKSIKVDVSNLSAIKRILLRNGYIKDDFDEMRKEFCLRNNIKEDDFYLLTQVQKNLFWDEYIIKRTIGIHEKALNIIEKYKGKYIYSYTFYDDIDSYLENQFQWPLPHIRIYNH